MSDYDEAAREAELVNQINRYIAENNMLAAELDTALSNVITLANNVDTMANAVVKDVNTLQSNTGTLDENTTMVQKAIEDLSNRYFLFKNLSTASKNLTQYTDEYYTRFSFYNKLRRITLGYVIGLDNAIISSETLRKEVEKNYLQNTDYWLAYAISAVMLWASDEKDAAKRALRKSISMDDCRTDVFFLLINLRFDRLDVAKDWYLDYLDKADLTALGSEYQYLLQAYLAGLFGSDAEFEKYVSDNFQQSLAKIDAVTVEFASKFTARARAYANAYINITEHEFPVLNEVSSDYSLLKKLLGKAECNTIFAEHYVELAERKEEYSEDQAQRIENVLYDLINAYDDEEWKVIKQQKYNEAIIEAKGDLRIAKEKYDLQYANLDKKKSLDEMMMDWAFSEDPQITNLVIKRFAISMMKDPIQRGYELFAEDYRKEEPQTINIEIDGYEMVCDEENAAEQEEKLAGFYVKDKLKNAFKDKYIQIFSVVSITSILLLVFTVFMFNPVTLTIGVLGAITGLFVLWRRYVEVGKILEEKKRLGLVKFKQAMEEFSSWRALFHEADVHNSDLRDAFSQF